MGYLTPWSWALLERPPVVQPLKKFSAFIYGTRRFITAFMRALHWSLSWVRPFQSIPTHPIFQNPCSWGLRHVKWVISNGLQRNHLNQYSNINIAFYTSLGTIRKLMFINMLEVSHTDQSPCPCYEIHAEGVSAVMPRLVYSIYTFSLCLWFLFLGVDVH
jgi:hypothetical protein